MTKVEQHVTYTVTKILHPDDVEQLRADMDAMYQRKVHPTTRAFVREIIEAIDEQGHGAQTEPEESIVVPASLTPHPASANGPITPDHVRINAAHPAATSEDDEPPLPIPPGSEEEAGFGDAVGIPEIPGMKTKADAVRAGSGWPQNEGLH